MTINPFHTDALDPIGKAVGEILKGDLPGHEFHGNQYAAGGGTHSERALAWAKEASELRASEGRTGMTFGKNHELIGAKHMDLGNELNQMVRTAQADPSSQSSQMVKDGIRGAQLAAQAHFAAAQAHLDIANGKIPYSAAEKQAQLDQAEALSHIAAMASNNPMHLGQRANGS